MNRWEGRMRRQVASGAVVLALCGVGSLAWNGCGNPESSRLAPGTAAFLFHETEKAVGVHELTQPVDGLPWAHVPVGTRVRVAKDDAPDASPFRKVRVLIDQGPHEGLGGEVSRNDLRPTR
jgi:hypothetical protein